MDGTFPILHAFSGLPISEKLGTASSVPAHRGGRSSAGISKAQLEADNHIAGRPVPGDTALPCLITDALSLNGFCTDNPGHRSRLDAAVRCGRRENAQQCRVPDRRHDARSGRVPAGQAWLHTHRRSARVLEPRREFLAASHHCWGQVSRRFGGGQSNIARQDPTTCFSARPERCHVLADIE